jgi:hypothetical protein
MKNRETSTRVFRFVRMDCTGSTLSNSWASQLRADEGLALYRVRPGGPHVVAPKPVALGQRRLLLPEPLRGHTASSETGIAFGS